MCSTMDIGVLPQITGAWRFYYADNIERGTSQQLKAESTRYSKRCSYLKLKLIKLILKFI